MDNYFADRLFLALERNDPAPGMLLVAAPGMYSEDFARSVVLILEHSQYTTFGVNLTTRLDVPVAVALPDWLGCVAKPQALYSGGPLHPETAVGVGVTRLGVDETQHAVFKRLANRLVHVDLRADPNEVVEHIEGMRLFAGFAEWAPGQLEQEISRGDWFVAPALPSDVIAPGPADVWGDVMKRQHFPLPLFSTFPVDLMDN
ncbi:YqgE/AlgH family protein [Corynebacterium sp.]|uniref:YqgE/AlgH family protein n=1 Tax=Corynebacterium sp. TaxID=1720 RepID=UPI0026DA6FEB|nr:YqgE/AlgH family protein [Corynebacterium sp.]MDO5077619.1 YqgE/AlgH family protein [Corynebacterium sp.]